MADSDIVIWFAEHHCFGDVLVARRHIAGWKVAEARHWLRVAFGDEAKDGSDEHVPGSCRGRTSPPAEAGSVAQSNRFCR